jgi:phage gpG-like protein
MTDVLFNTTISVDDGELEPKLNALMTNLSIFKKPFDRTIIWMHRSFGDSFKAHKRGTSTWLPNSEATKIIKKGNNPLQNNNFLKLSLTGINSYTHLKEGDTSLEFGTVAPYASVQNKGTVIPVTQKMRLFMAWKHGIILGDKVTIPARKFMFFTDEDIKTIEKIFVDWIKEEVAAVV